MRNSLNPNSQTFEVNTRICTSYSTKTDNYTNEL